MSLPPTIQIAGASWPTSMPSLATREDLVLRYGAAQDGGGGLGVLRVLAAAVGLCSGVGPAAKASLPRVDYRILEYGDAVYSWLRERGATPQEIAEAGGACFAALVGQMAPREAEVDAAAGFSGPGAAG